MVFNFKNNNLIIILLLVLLISSCLCYNIMQNNIEGNENMNNSIFSDVFKIHEKDYLNNIEYYTIRPYDNTPEIKFSVTSGESDLTPVEIEKTEVDKSHNVFEYMKQNNYQMYIIEPSAATPGTPVPPDATTVVNTPTTTIKYKFYRLIKPLELELILQFSEAPPPEEGTPDETTPDETTPDETTPDETTPDETTPDETTQNTLPSPSPVAEPPIVQLQSPDTLQSSDTLPPGMPPPDWREKMSVGEQVEMAMEDLRTEIAAYEQALNMPGDPTQRGSPPRAMMEAGLAGLQANLKRLEAIERSQSTIHDATESFTGIQNGNLLFAIKNNDYTKALDTVGNVLKITIKLEHDILVQNGEIKILPPTEDTKPKKDADANINTNIVGGGEGGSVGDINISGLGNSYGGIFPSRRRRPFFGNRSDMHAFMLNNDSHDHHALSQYRPPHYSSFEAAMNNPSNPIVNPINAMNPLEYSQNLFGPSVTPMMAKNSCVNCNVDNAENVNNGENNNGNNNGNNSLLPNLNLTAPANLLTQNVLDDNGNDNLTKINQARNNGNNGNRGNSNNSDNSENKGACPPCARCPDQSNFECKKVPNYEQGYDNAFLPRPVLSDFSTFGM